MIKTLNLKKSFQLYEILEPYLTELEETSSYLEVAIVIIKKSTENNDGAYARSLSLMTGHNFEELADFPSSHNIKLFVEGLQKNNVYELKLFCESLINGR